MGRVGLIGYPLTDLLRRRFRCAMLWLTTCEESSMDSSRDLRIRPTKMSRSDHNRCG